MSDATLISLVSDLRAALGGKSAPNQFIRTVHGFGYAFAASVTGGAGVAAELPVHRLIVNGAVIALRDGEYVIGRDIGAHVQLATPSVSRHHARLFISGMVAAVEDLGSKNGTRVGGEPLNGRRVLQDGDQIAVGSCRLQYRSPGRNATTQSLSDSSF